MKESGFERIIGRLVRELLNEPETNAVLQDAYEKARRANDKEQMNRIDNESMCHSRKIAFVKMLLKKLWEDE